jgi:hypothetical protein
MAPVFCMALLGLHLARVHKLLRWGRMWLHVFQCCYALDIMPGRIIKKLPA